MITAHRRAREHPSRPYGATAARLAACVAAWTGHRPDAIRRAAVDQFVEATLDAGATVEDIDERAARGDPALARATLAAVTVGETFFFRQPEHFRWIARSAARWNEGKIRAWSAGCATGEEAYSLAACLADAVDPREFTVLGTDLVDENVERARAGRFGSWSLRADSPLVFPLLCAAPSGSDRPLTVVASVRERVRFERHNLLDDPPPCSGGFHIILCRNVLLYFTPEAARAAAARLASALAPNGVLVFGALDISAPPEGLCRVGPPELNIFERASMPRVTSVRPSRRPSMRVPTRQPSGAHRLSMRLGPIVAVTHVTQRSSDGVRGENAPTLRFADAATPPRSPQTAAAIALHRRVLACVERGQRSRAERLIDELRAAAPDYLPGLLEEALFHARAGRIDSARHALRALARKCEGLAGETVVPGPEDLSIEYYRIASQSFTIAEAGHVAGAAVRSRKASRGRGPE